MDVANMLLCGEVVDEIIELKIKNKKLMDEINLKLGVEGK